MYEMVFILTLLISSEVVLAGRVLQFACHNQPREFSEFRRNGTLYGVCMSGCASFKNVTVSGSSRYYTDDSSICRSALHAGAINRNGGAVHMRRSSGRQSYPSTRHNGVTSQATQKWQSNYTFYFESQKCVHTLDLRRKVFDQEHFQSSVVDRTWFGAKWFAHLAILDSASLVNAWRPAVDNQEQWWQLDMDDIYHVHGIITQGSSRYGSAQYITKYKIKYRMDIDGTWLYALPSSGKEKIFEGNSDNDGMVTNHFAPSFTARFIRLEPVSWHNHISLRAEILVCDIGQSGNL